MEYNFNVKFVNKTRILKDKFNMIFGFPEIGCVTKLYINKNDIVNFEIKNMMAGFEYYAYINDTFYGLTDNIDITDVEGYIYLVYTINEFVDINEKVPEAIITIHSDRDLITNDKMIIETSKCVIETNYYEYLNNDFYNQIDEYIEMCCDITNIDTNYIYKIYVKSYGYSSNIIDQEINLHLDDTKRLLDTGDLCNCWALLHEIGHHFQGGITFPTCIESSVNLFPNIYLDIKGKLTRDTNVDIQNKKFFDLGCWEKMDMYYGLYEKFGMDFYQELFSLLNSDKLSFNINNNIIQANHSYLKFIRYCCEISNVNLYEYFNKFHMFDYDEGTINLSEYVDFTIYVSKQDVINTIDYCNSF